MRIVNRKTFLEMPDGTAFVKYTSCAFGGLAIKGDTVGENDFVFLTLADAVKAGSDMEMFDLLLEAEKTSASIEMDFENGGRDGLFDMDQLFVIYEKADLEAMVNQLQAAIWVEDKKTGDDNGR